MKFRLSFETERRLRRMAVPNLMNYIVGGMALCYVLMMAIPGLYGMLGLSRAAIFRGQIWRLATFVFLPSGGSVISMLISLYFYWMIGSTLERQWGTFKFNLFYFTGVLGAILSALITGRAGNSYLNLSMFLVFASMFPDYQVLLFYILPIKMKYLAYLDWAIFAFDLLTGSWPAKVAIIASLINFFIFFGPDILDRIRRRRGNNVQRNFRNYYRNR